MTTIIPSIIGPDLAVDTRPLPPSGVARINHETVLGETGARILFWWLGERLGLLPLDFNYDWAHSDSKRLPRS